MENEVEVKVSLAADEFARVREFLVEVGAPSTLEEHCDVYFSRVGGFLDEKYPFEWLSIRQRNGAASVCYKHFFPEGAEEHTHCHEVELVVASADVACVLLASLGFDEVVAVKKRRTSFLYKRTRVALDVVDQLGLFAEVEATERKDLGEAADSVREALRDLGLAAAARDLRGYPYRMLELKGLV